MNAIPSTIEFDLAVKKINNQDTRARTNEGFSSTLGARKLTARSLSAVTEGVVSALNNSNKLRTDSMEFKLQRVLRGLDVEVIALACLMPALNSVALEHTHRDAALAIGGSLWTEAYMRKLLVTDKKAAGSITKAAGERFASVKLRQAKVIKDAEKRLGFTMEEWTRPMRLHAGQWGINILLQALPHVFELREIPNDAEKAWSVTDEAATMMDDVVNDAVLKSPVYQPRTVKPNDWTGFYSKIAEDRRFASVAVPLVRTLHKETVAAIKHAIRTGQMDGVMRAVNNLQSVPYKINGWLLGILQECDHLGIEVKGVPPQKPKKVTPRSPDDVWAAMTKAEQGRRAAQIKIEKKRNRIDKAARFKFNIDLSVARRMQIVDQFFTPMNLDWRGRVYYLTQFNFQREDYVRGMFLFANGKPVGERGIYHLKLQVANTWSGEQKLDKQPMPVRVKWCDDNIDLLRDFVARPLHNTDWTKADKPFAFLAAARELVNAWDNPSYVCHLPVAFDGSCNGLQHLCAMTRAEEGKFVNLTDNASPEDIYQMVADAALKSIEADKYSDVLYYAQGPADAPRKANATLGDLAQLALSYGVNRKLVKRNVLSFAYSSKENGMKDQHVEDTIDAEALKGNYPFGTTFAEQQLAASYLAKRTMAAIKGVVTKPAEAMAFMQKLAQVLAHEGKALTWKTPMGLPWINRYHASNVRVIRLSCYSKGVRIPVDTMLSDGFDTAIAKREVSNGVAPNFVHALDGCHLQASVNAAVDRGIVDFATVHDSYGCLPADADLFNEVIREEFLRIYVDRDVLQELLDDAISQLSEAGRAKLDKELEKAPKPVPGDLPLEQIISAVYAFA
jgi:DNA-directed RNA polymerase